MVIIAAARVGGILANWEYPYEFVQENLAIELNVIHEAFRAGVRRLIFLGSSCIYPKLAPQPLKEEYLLTGPLEETNRAYAIAKIAGIELCRSLNREYGTDYLSLMPTNLYGPGDNFDLETSHLVPALIRKFHEAKAAGRRRPGAGERRTGACGHSGAPARPGARCSSWTIWPHAVCLLLEGEELERRPRRTAQRRHRRRRTPSPSWPRWSPGGGLRRARSNWDASKPDGTPQKLMDVSRIRNLGWEADNGLPRASRATYEWFLRTSPPYRMGGRRAHRRRDVSKTALITGVTGQDGAYLSEYLLDKGYIVHGIKRRSSLINTDRVDHLYHDPHLTGRALLPPLRRHDRRHQPHPHHPGDPAGRDLQPGRPVARAGVVRDAGVHRQLRRPGHAAAAGGHPHPGDGEEVPLLSGLHLRALRQRRRDPQSETTPFSPRSPYAAAKLYAYWITVNYREAYGLHASNGILFNHESPIRGETFVTRKITRAVARIALGIQDVVYLGNLDSRRDWGHARDYVRAM